MRNVEAREDFLFNQFQSSSTPQLFYQLLFKKLSGMERWVIASLLCDRYLNENPDNLALFEAELGLNKAPKEKPLPFVSEEIAEEAKEAQISNLDLPAEQGFKRKRGRPKSA